MVSTGRTTKARTRILEKIVVAASGVADLVIRSRLVYPIGGTLAKCDPFGTPSTSHWTGAAIIVQSPRTKTCIVTRSRTSTRPMPFSLAG